MADERRKLTAKVETCLPERLPRENIHRSTSGPRREDDRVHRDLSERQANMLSWVVKGALATVLTHVSLQHSGERVLLLLGRRTKVPRSSRIDRSIWERARREVSCRSSIEKREIGNRLTEVLSSAVVRVGRLAVDDAAFALDGRVVRERSVRAGRGDVFVRESAVRKKRRTTSQRPQIGGTEEQH